MAYNASHLGRFATSRLNQENDSMNESGQMRWNLGGWLGGQVGGSCWMLVAGLLAISADLTAAIEVVGLFAFANLAGLADLAPPRIAVALQGPADTDPGTWCDWHRCSVCP